MKTLQKLLTVAGFILAFALAGNAQTALVQTTLSAAINSSQTNIVLASVTGLARNTYGIYIDREFMTITAVNTTSRVVSVVRGANGTRGTSHAASTMVLYGVTGASSGGFQNYDPYGSCVTAQQQYTPWVNVLNGNQWLCSTVTLTWVPGWGNYDAEQAVTTLVASAAGAILPSGPLFHVNGTQAVTGFTVPVGCNATVRGGCSFTIIPDAAFTWTTAGNIADSGTAVANQIIKFIWDATNSKFVQLQSE